MPPLPHHAGSHTLDTIRPGTPQKSNIDTKNGHIFSKESPFPTPIILGIQPLVFGGVYSLHLRYQPGFPRPGVDVFLCGQGLWGFLEPDGTVSDLGKL